MIDVLGIGAGGGGDLFGGAGVGGEMGADVVEGCQEIPGGFFAGFDARLVIGVDVDQRGVERDRAFEQGDEQPELKGVTSGIEMVSDLRPAS